MSYEQRDSSNKNGFTLSVEQQNAWKVMCAGSNVFLSGITGTGKSFLINRFVKENKNKNIIVCATTDMAAESIGGEALCKAFSIPTGILKVGSYNAAPDRKIVDADIIIIDEISMCRIDVFEYVFRTLQNISKHKKTEGILDHSKKQIILVGDFYKLPSQVSREDKPAFVSEWGLKRREDFLPFNSSLWDELHLDNIILREPMCENRDVKYLVNLEKIREANEADISIKMYEKLLRATKVVCDFYDDNYHMKKLNARDYSEWSHDEDGRLLDEWANGLGIDEISRIHGRTIGAIRSRLMKIPICGWTCA
ncbi:AAA family ATPase [Butyrivibrio sp. WCE2006]|uniref:AAA family ATPase n=1 Tax=Butyrivibrio sp. WCE2006 TaxID=1410611 RepID=UPI0005D2825B|nr:AAA family ATPase [Butyrivibrio sp. WCE2006]